MHTMKFWLFLLPGLLLAQSATAPAPGQATGPLKLEPDKTLERKLSAGSTDVFALDLKKDQIVSLTLKDQGKEVILSVRGPGGDLQRAFSSALEAGGPCTFLAQQAGNWTLKVSARARDASAAYSISGLRIATPKAPAPPPPDSDASPRIGKLIDQAGVDAFWKEIGPGGSPLVEPLKDDPDNRLASFLWRGGAGTTGVFVFYQPCLAVDPADCLMKHLEGTDLWYKTFKIDHRVRTTYSLAPNPPAFTRQSSQTPEILEQILVRMQRDPLNPKSMRESPGDPDVPEHRGVSRLEMPDAPPQPWLQKRAGVPEGKIVEQDFSSALLKNTRKISIYTPTGYSKDAAPYDLLLVFDGETYINVVPTPVTLDNLISEKRIPPTVAVIIGNAPGARSAELPCNPAFAEFLNSELVAWVRRAYNVTHDPRRVTVGGSSYGGLAATYAAYQHPETFGNVLSQSGSYWWTPPTDPSKPSSFAKDVDPSYVAQLFINRPRLPVRFYLDAGSMELDLSGKGGSILVPNRHFRDVLRAKGYEVFYQEFQGAHDYASWRGTLADGLILLTGNPPEPAKP
jgi:enterochelin esterase-like enzyme